MQNTTSPVLKQFGDTHFIAMDTQGVHVDLAALDSSAQFCAFIDRVFTAGYYLSQLDYPTFLGLIRNYTPEMLATRADISLQKTGRLRLAADITLFPAERQALYRPPFIADDSGEYLFEPRMIDKTVSIPIYEELEDGTQDVINVEQKVVQVRARLDFDEFVAAMWLKGLRYGIEEATVREMIGSSKFARVAIAHALPVTPGRDANLVEIGSQMRRDDSPRKLPNGAIDLRHFGNRFPQVRSGDRLMQKIPRQLGAPGISLGGRALEAPLPEDFDLGLLAGEGTHIVRQADGEFLIANKDGFLNIDTGNSRISVTEKIINYSGVSLRTTGDIALGGDHFEEHGEIQEKRVVKGKNITVMADVFGEVISQGGLVHLRQNLVGGTARNQDGDITVDGLTSNAHVEAHKGTITLQRAENVVILGQRIHIDTAINCCIVGEEIQIQHALGSQIAGKVIHIAQAEARRQTPTVVAVLLPDLTTLNNRINEMRLRSSEITEETESLRKKYDALVADQEVRHYLTLAGKLQRRELQLSAEQKTNLLKVKQRILPSLTAAGTLNRQIQGLIGEQKALVERATAMRQQSVQAHAAVSCQIAQCADDTLVRKLRLPLSNLYTLPERMLRMQLMATGPAEERIFVHGTALDWQPEPQG